MDAFKKAMAEAEIQEQVAMKKAARPRGTDSAKVIPVIRTIALKGRGTIDDPCKGVVQIWSLTGKLLATIDECDYHGCE